ncbi:hypothetical protein B0H14DRAFT_2653876 [Mycena olivaceomarginata]|nr:hypothetical protein B0H14DRAFT_2653876 [Mycena olivaceomarginata]
MPIKAKEAQPAVEKFRRQQGQRSWTSGATSGTKVSSLTNIWIESHQKLLFPDILMGNTWPMLFLHVIDRIGAAKKLGWDTLDNASNNDTFMLWVEILLRRRAISYSRTERQIRCFPHIVHLSCKAILKAITDMDFADNEETNLKPKGTLQQLSWMRSTVTPIATLRAIIHQFFSDVLKSLKLKNLELLRDMITRWSSTPLTASYFAQYPLPFNRSYRQRKPPHSAMLCRRSKQLIKKWEQMQLDNPDIIQQGLAKLGSYQEHLERVPAYTLAMTLMAQPVLASETGMGETVIKDSLREYDNNPIDSPVRCPTYNSWADEILGLKDPALHGDSGNSVDDEVNNSLVLVCWITGRQVRHYGRGQSNPSTLSPGNDWDAK